MEADSVEWGGESGGAPRSLPPFDCAAYSMLFFKVLPCLKKYNHDWTACPGAHPGERARRRCLLVYRYGAKVCPDMQTRGTCPRGESCYMTHGMFEYYMHPLKYKTKMCKSGPNCRRHYCFFSHSPEELRESSNIPDEWQLQVQADGTFSTGSVAQVLACLPPETRPPAQAAIAQLPQIMAMFEAESRSGIMQPVSVGAAAAGWMGSACIPEGMQAAGVAAAGAYSSPSMMHSSQQQTFNGMLTQQQQQQQQQEFAQYGAACGLSSCQAPHVQQQPMMLMPQQADPMPFNHSGNSSTTSSQSTLSVVLPGQASGIAGAATATAAAAAGSPVYAGHHHAPAAGLQRMAVAPGNWNPPGPQRAQLAYAVAPSSAAAAMQQQQQPLLQANYVVPAHGGGMMLQAPAGPAMYMQQHQQPVSAPQQQPVHIPETSTVLMWQQQQPQFLAAAGVSPQTSGLTGGAPQPVAVAADDALVQQLQALGLTTTSMAQQMH